MSAVLWRLRVPRSDPNQACLQSALLTSQPDTSRLTSPDRRTTLLTYEITRPRRLVAWLILTVPADAVRGMTLDTLLKLARTVPRGAPGKSAVAPCGPGRRIIPGQGVLIEVRTYESDITGVRLSMLPAAEQVVCTACGAFGAVRVLIDNTPAAVCPGGRCLSAVWARIHGREAPAYGAEAA